MPKDDIAKALYDTCTTCHKASPEVFKDILYGFVCRKCFYKLFAQEASLWDDFQEEKGLDRLLEDIKKDD